MTSPGISKPVQRVKDYDAVHAKGSRFGQDLSESKIRAMLSSRVQSPFAKAAQDFTSAINGVIGGIAQAIRGDGGASYTAISGAVTDRLGPIESSITQAGEKVTELGNKVSASVKEQERLAGVSEALRTDVDAVTGKAASTLEKLTQFESDQTAKVSALTAKADAATAKLNTIVTDQGALVGKFKTAADNAASAVSNLSRVEREYKAADQAINTAVSGLTTTATDALAKADAAQNAINTTNQNLAANIKAGVEQNAVVQTAAQQAQQATSTLLSQVDIGASLIANIPGTTTPDWSRAATITTKPADVPAPPVNTPVFGAGPNVDKVYIPQYRKVKVSAGVTYDYSFYAYTNVATTRFLIRMWSEELNTYAIQTQTYLPGQAAGSGWGIGGVAILPRANEWIKFEGTFTVRAGTEYVGIDQVEWHHSSSPIKDSSVFLTDLRVTPHIPDQATIDNLQNNAILKNTTVGSENAKAIDVLTGAWNTQLTVNANQQKWNEGASTAIAANTAAIRLAFPEMNLLPYTSAGRAYWASNIGASGRAATTLGGVPAYYQPPTVSVSDNTDQGAYFDVVEGVPLRLFFMYKFDADAASADMSLWLKDESGDRVAEVRKVREKLRSPDTAWTETGDTWRTDTRIYTVGVKGRWEEEEWHVKLAPGTKKIRFRLQTNSNSGVTFAGPYITSFAPLQEQTDSAQNTAIAALSESAKAASNFAASQTEWNKTSETATRANRDAIKALARVDTGSSLIAYKDLTDADIAAGKVVQDTPQWTDTARISGTDTIGGITRKWYGTPAGSTTRTTPPAERKYMKVEPGQVYKFSCWMKADVEGSRIYAQFVTTPGDPVTAVFENLNADGSGTGVYTNYLIINHTVPTTWTYYEKKVRAREGATNVAYAATFWNHFNGTASAQQQIADMQFAPDIPTQQQVDEAQNKAIEGLNKAQEVDAKFQTEQVRINKVTQNQIAIHQDLLELLDIQNPKIVGWLRGSEPRKEVGPGSGTAIGVQESPYFKAWTYSTSMYVDFKGEWTGHATVSLNWTNGAVDEWTVELNPGRSRRYRFDGGDPFGTIYIRNITITCYPSSLRRKASMKLLSGDYVRPDGSVVTPSYSGDPTRPKRHFNMRTDPNSLFREAFVERLRIKNAVTCNHDIYIRDENNNRALFTAGAVLYSPVIYPEDQDLSDVTLEFLEFDMEEVNYTVPGTLPTGDITEIKAKK